MSSYLKKYIAISYCSFPAYKSKRAGRRQNGKNNNSGTWPKCYSMPPMADEDIDDEFVLIPGINLVKQRPRLSTVYTTTLPQRSDSIKRDPTTHSEELLSTPGFTTKHANLHHEQDDSYQGGQGESIEGGDTSIVSHKPNPDELLEFMKRKHRPSVSQIQDYTPPSNNLSPPLPSSLPPTSRTSNSTNSSCNSIPHTR